jgi:hypothetical protein
MIDDPPLITLRRKVPRPTGAQLAELKHPYWLHY